MSRHNTNESDQRAGDTTLISTVHSSAFDSSSLKKQKIYFGNNTTDLGNFSIKDNVLVRNKGGLSWFLTALFLLADMAGGGLVAMPHAVVNASFIGGFIIIFIFATAATISSVLLGKAWVILLRRYPEYRIHCRKPYAEIGKRALGPFMMRFSSGCVNFTQYGASVVFLLLSAKNINEFLWTAIDVDIGFCTMIIILALFLLPITLLKSPQDFWPVIIMGMFSTFVAVGLVCWGAWRDAGCQGTQPEATFQPLRVFEGLGIVLFSFGGHSAFPTIQHDMSRPADFDKSSYFGFGVITLVNILVVAFGGITYGTSMSSSIISSIQTVWMRQVINLLIAAHCLLTVTLIINPLNQEIEELLNVPQGFSLKRILARTAVMAVVVFTAETVPSFGSVMDLMGGSTVTMTSLVLPCIFYLLIAAEERKSHEKHFTNGESLKSPTYLDDEMKPISFIGMLKRTRPLTLLVCTVVCVIGLVAGVAATVSAAYAMYNEHFVPPCYARFLYPDKSASPILKANNTITLTSLNCCGEFRNYSLFGGHCMS